MTNTITAFAGTTKLASGPVDHVRDALLAYLRAPGSQPILIFDDETGRQIDIDMRPGVTAFDDAPVPDNVPVPDTVKARPRGRPRLGVVAGEITLLPRHWDWLRTQRGGSSATVRRLIDEARKNRCDPAKARDAAYHFLSAIAGNLPNYEDVLRALYAGDSATFAEKTKSWPAAIRDHAFTLAEHGFAAR